MFVGYEVVLTLGSTLAKFNNAVEHLWHILKREVEESKASNIHRRCDVIMKERERIQVETRAALVNFQVHRS